MLFALTDTGKRQPAVKGEHGICPSCKNEVLAVIPIQNVRHWRHKAKDCDPWSEPEGEWHLWWKTHFKPEHTEVALLDSESGETHRADILVPGNPGTVVELQHSSISEEERILRENFYSKNHRFFWLLHIHNEKSFRAYNFGFSLNWDNPIEIAGKEFFKMHWAGNTQFIERWKKADSHVFFACGENIYYLATNRACRSVVAAQKKGEFAIHPMSQVQFFEAIHA